MSELFYLFLTDKGFIDVSSKLLYRIIVQYTERQGISHFVKYSLPF